MTTRNRSNVVLTLAAAAVCFCVTATANAGNLSLNKTYAYFVTVPGQVPHYADDSHAVYTTGLGAFDSGDLTDGLFTDGNDGAIPSRVVAVRAGGGGGIPIDIIFDLEATNSVDDIVIGTSRRPCCGNFSPDDVNISYSTTGIGAGDFGAATHYDLWIPLQNGPEGHDELTLAVGGVSARYVKLSFDGQASEKYMFDEITINGTFVPEPTTFLLATLGLLGLLGWGRRKRRRAT